MFSTRLRVDTRALLTEAARVANRSLSQELEVRVRSTFRQDEQDRAFYGEDKEIEGVVRFIAATIGLVVQQASSKKKRDWLCEQWLFDSVVDAINHALLLFRPGGDEGRREITLSTSTNAADRLIEEIQASDPTLPFHRGTDRQHAAAKLKRKLGPLIEREHPYWKWSKKEPPIKFVVVPASHYFRRTSEKTKRKTRRKEKVS
jgi:hypothetical protein